LTTIAAAFRKKAIKLHPDRNKATNAGDQFIKLNQSFKLLADPVYREKMNKVLKAKKIREQKFKEMSAKRQNLKTSLEKAEKQFENANDQKKSELNKTKLDEMRKENIELLKKHNDEQKGTKPLKNTKPDKIFHFGIKLAVEKSAEQVELNKSIAKSLINQFGKIKEYVSKDKSKLALFEIELSESEFEAMEALLKSINIDLKIRDKELVVDSKAKTSTKKQQLKNEDDSSQVSFEQTVLTKLLSKT